MGIWAQIKMALNRTLGRDDFLPLDEIVKSEIQDSENRILRAISPNGVLSIPKGTFEIEDREYQSSNYVFVSIPVGVKKIGNFAFGQSTSLREVVFPIGLEEIGTSAFSQCISLKNADLPNSLVELGSDAFGECDLLFVRIPDGFEVFPSLSFRSASIKNLKIPKTTRSIEVFSEADVDDGYALTVENIYYGGTISMFREIEGFENFGLWSDDTVVVHCQDGEIELV